MTPIRYPGGKTKLCCQIMAAIHEQVDHTEISRYVEPFFGGGGAGINVLKELPQFRYIHVNDKDVALASYWTSIMRYPDALIQMIQDFSPSVAKYYEFKAALKNVAGFEEDEKTILRIGFMKIALHNCSYGGLGEKGGALGGRTPLAGSNAIASRWSPNRLSKEIREANHMFSGVNLPGNRCTTDDFSDVIDGGNRALIYLDPPYFEKGGELYKHAFTEADHLRLADKLKTSEHCWVLSYDDHPQIRKMYAGWADLRTIKDVQYSINGSCKKSELLIVPKPRLQFHVGLPA